MSEIEREIIVSRDEAKAHLNLTGIDTDDALIDRLLAAAQRHVEAMLGFDLDNVKYPDTADDDYPATVPEPLRQATLMLIAHWYANREATLVGISAQEVPVGLWDIVNSHRTWTF